MPMVAIDEDDEAGLTESVGGDPEAFEALIHQHQRMIHSLCFRMTGSMADAEDLAQDTFIQAFRHFHQFRADAKVSSWLYRIAMNLCLNWQKRRQRQERLHRDWAQDPPGPTEVDKRSHAIAEALLKLAPKQRSAIVLTAQEGLTHAEAARILGCSETTVSWRLFAARRKLKKLLSIDPSSGGLRHD